ncbi:NAD-dependent epimerase/dehydratase family protein [Streptomyces sp. NPDC058735]|uniref:NAD-dependent epimerase/dehydratase family protein n=1 Tax=unclassified Streptomyces TaxID=2593676 RepID=UPI0036AE333C
MNGPAWRRALVTGGAGFVGSHLYARLLRGGTHVVCLDNLGTGSRANVAELERWPGFRCIHGDATDPAVRRSLPARSTSSCTSRVPPRPGPRPRRRRPARPALRVSRLALDRARADGARLVLASTSEVYGDPLEHPQHEGYRAT